MHETIQTANECLGWSKVAENVRFQRKCFWLDEQETRLDYLHLGAVIAVGVSSQSNSSKFSQNLKEKYDFSPFDWFVEISTARKYFW